MPAQPEVRIVNTPAELFQAAATEFATLALQAVHSHGRFSVALSGGSTPKTLYALLSMLDPPECQVDPRLVNLRFFWYLMPEVSLSLSRHN